MNIPAVSSSSTAASSGSEARRRPSADEMFDKLDSEGKGYLTESDLASISPEGSAKAEEMFKKMDSDGDGQVSKSEFTAAAEKMEKQGPPQGARPSGGGHGGGGAGAAAAASSGSKTYEPADANEDGKVSEQEQQAYDAKQAQADAAVKAYEDVAKAQ